MLRVHWLASILPLGCLILCVLQGCGGPAPAGSPSGSHPDTARGGRLFDNWVSEKKLQEEFEPDPPKTPELDGKGGPNRNGTLSNGFGRALPNTGHDYRLKNLFGWDLRGSQGIYGPSHQKKSFVLAESLLDGPRTEQQIGRWLKSGDENLPAYGSMLDGRDLRDLAAFIAAVRERRLPRPDDIFTLDAATPKNYRLKPGANPGRGAALVAKRCSACHGPNGTNIEIDGTESIGSISRTNGYEVWLKIINGHPGSPMKSQLLKGDGDAAARAGVVLDILAALCDRKRFPKPAGEDVADGDPRCGDYLR
jgi:hypothetical protein